MSEVWSLESLKGRISSFYNEKQAAEKSAQGNMPSETDPQEKSAPGAEKHDGDSAEKTVLPAAGLATENRDGNAENNIPGGTSGEASGKEPNGAGEGGHSAADGDSKDDAVKTPTDPNVAKTASKAKSLADSIRTNLLNKQAKKKDDKKEEKEAYEDKESKEPTPAQEKNLPPEVLKGIKAAEPEEKEAADIEATASDFEEDKNAYQKIASLVMSYEEGRQLVTDLADRELGKQAAENLIKEAAEIEYMQQAFEQEQANAAAEVEEMLKGASEEDVQDIEKLMVLHGGAVESFESDEEKQAYDLGVKQAAAAMDEEGGELPMEGEDVSLDEVAAVIMQMVESGEIDPQLAEAILTELAGADGGAGMGGGEEAMMGGEEAMMDPAMAEEAKMASDMFGQDTVSELQKTAAVLADIK
jgi:hypothetical protein